VGCPLSVMGECASNLSLINATTTQKGKRSIGQISDLLSASQPSGFRTTAEAYGSHAVLVVSSEELSTHQIGIAGFVSMAPSKKEEIGDKKN